MSIKNVDFVFTSLYSVWSKNKKELLMSHYACLVIGKKPEDQLAPFDENIAGNKNAKWDWYVLGGRFTGYFKLKKNRPGELGERGVFNNSPKKGYADIVKLKDIDFEGMRCDAIKLATKRYSTLNKLCNNEIPKLIPWEKFEKEKKSIKEKRDLYWNQEGFKRFNSLKKNANKKDKDFLEEIDLDKFQMSQEEYVTKHANKAGVPFAIIKDGKWHEKGEMGWFAMVSDEKTDEKWQKEVAKLFSDLPPNTVFSLYDLHI